MSQAEKNKAGEGADAEEAEVSAEFRTKNGCGTVKIETRCSAQNIGDEVKEKRIVAHKNSIKELKSEFILLYTV